jgi:NADH dehydrogenase FAD-containing subunit
MDGLEPTEMLIPIKPMQTFPQRLSQRLEKLHDATSAAHIVVVGGGVGGVEIAFCLPNLLRKSWGSRRFEISLVHGAARLMPGTLSGTSDLVHDELKRRHTKLEIGSRVESVGEKYVRLANGRELEADLVIWATSARGAPILGQLGLATDERGFLRTRATLQTLTDDSIFAVGDAGTIEHANISKAGVYAVRQGPVLWENIQRSLKKQPLRGYVPQSEFLKLLNTGDNRAIAEYRGRTFHGRWCWRLKDYIDRRFVRTYQDYAMPKADPQ